MSAQVRIAAATLRELVTAIFLGSGSAEDEAGAIASHLVGSDLVGHPSHGVGLVPMYLDHLARGYVRANIKPRPGGDGRAVIAFDACGGYGKPAADAMMREAIQRCGEYGVCVATLGNGHHLGRLGAFGEEAAHAGLICIQFANVLGMDPLVAPFGGAEARLSTNPVCIAVPCAGDPPVLLFDASTSAIAMNKVRIALEAGAPLPRESVIDGHGRATLDPSVMFDEPRGTLLPMGQHKGYALAVMCELLAGTLSGSGARPRPPDSGSGLVNNLLTILLDPLRWVSSESLRHDAEALVRYLHQTTPSVREYPVLVPGEPEWRARRENEAHGIPVPAKLLAELQSLAHSPHPASLDARQ